MIGAQAAVERAATLDRGEGIRRMRWNLGLDPLRICRLSTPQNRLEGTVLRAGLAQKNVSAMGDTLRWNSRQAGGANALGG